MTVITGGSLGLGIAAAADSNTSGGDTGAPRGLTPNPADVTGAVVRSNGGLARATTSGVSSDGLGRGIYEVIFPFDVTSCTFAATIGKSNFFGVSRPGFITTAGRRGRPNAVFVQTRNANGKGAKRPFHLVMACPDSPV
ncbi:MAG: hypothetical protein ACRDGK_10240 [Actinomycetota bacterium]